MGGQAAGGSRDEVAGGSVGAVAAAGETVDPAEGSGGVVGLAAPPPASPSACVAARRCRARVPGCSEI